MNNEKSSKLEYTWVGLATGLILATIFYFGFDCLSRLQGKEPWSFDFILILFWFILWIYLPFISFFTVVGFIIDKKKMSLARKIFWLVMSLIVPLILIALYLIIMSLIYVYVLGGDIKLM